ncbi:MAG: J domain-containing protein [Betaproteobacteria bacterium]|uniref:J domain-containing protein n=1 Tax=Candidatus Proximibacter danicus TaxID=2954365 RepID=A0A9D7PS74_9PROT|nr:J domain-containing protein [Candidatus Proximibacter danicus]
MHAMCHYTLLGIATDAGLEEIQAAYAKAISRFKRRLSEGKPLPVEHLDALRTAYQVLAHPAHGRPMTGFVQKRRACPAP